MTTTPTTPFLPASWSPTVAGCLKPSDFWQWDYGSVDDTRTVLGGPSQTTNCLPTAWASDIVYSGSECPPYYTSACQGNDSLSAVTCCPLLYGFECKPLVLPFNHGSQFRCISAWATSGAVRVTHTNFIVNTITVEPQAARTDAHLFALAIIYVTSTLEPSANSATASTDLSVSSPHTGTRSQPTGPTVQPGFEHNSQTTSISTGASAGIGVGAAAVVVILSIAAWWMYHRRRARRQAPKLSTKRYPYTPAMAEHEVSNKGPKDREAEPPTRSELSSSSPAAQELPAHPL